GLDSLRRKRVVQSLDIATDTRWPAWGPCVAHGLGARSVLCLRLYADDSTIGVLRLYARRAEAFDEQDREDGVILAAYVALAVATSRQLTNLTRALDSRTMIAQACGVLMERFRLGPSAAFAALVRISSESNRKLRDVAAELVETGVLPESVREQD
ncbi:MAG: GAF and ANTAR domain-containing protein, partial [Marmoricola sp.]|nr:GAF and ANTAR domain-containing protein [Marmoricola sp.]